MIGSSPSPCPRVRYLILKPCWDLLPLFSLGEGPGLRGGSMSAGLDRKFVSETALSGNFGTPSELWCPACQLFFTACLSAGARHLKVWLQGTQIGISWCGNFALPQPAQEREASGGACSHQNNSPSPYGLGATLGLWDSREAISWLHCLGNRMCKTLSWGYCHKEKPCVIPWEYCVHMNSTVQKARKSILCQRGDDASTSFSSSPPSPKVYTTPQRLTIRSHFKQWNFL